MDNLGKFPTNIKHLIKYANSLRITMTSGRSPFMVDPAIFEHLQTKIDEDTQAQDVSEAIDVNGSVLI